MGSSSKGQTIGFRYLMSLHMGVSRGPIDELVEIRVGDQKAWPLGEQPTMTDDNFTPGFSIDAPELFGGDKKEGGIKGTMALMMGKATQDPPTWIRSLMGGRVPGFRGVTTMFFDGMICAMNPYPKPWKVRARRTTCGWDGTVWHPDLAMIPLAGGAIKAMNPAHIVFECLTNRQWGRGLPRERLDDASLLTAAERLYGENFGICRLWNRQDSLQAFIQNVVDHVGGALFLDRTTGLIRFDLIRGDYDANALPLYDKNSGLLDIEDGDTESREDAINEIIVNWHDPIENMDRQVRVQNLASIQSLGGAVNSQTTDYLGLPTLDLATRVAQRDLRVMASALKRFKVRLDRRAWSMSPGSLFRVNAPERNINNLVLRVGRFADGPVTEGAIEVSAVVDVFGLPAASFISEEENQWTPPDRSAQVIGDRLVREPNHRDLVRALSVDDLERLVATQGAALAMAAKPTSLSLSFQVASKTSGEADYVNRATGTFCPKMELTGSLTATATTVNFDNGVDLSLVEVGAAAQIGAEIVRIDAITIDSTGVAGSMTIARGCADTIPAPHASGSLVFVFDEGVGLDMRELSSGETANIKLLSATSSQVLSVSLAPADNLPIVARQARPYPPGNLKLNSTGYASVGSVSGAADVVVSWAHRDRLGQADQLVSHGETSFGPEVGTTYTIRIFRTDVASSPIRTVTGLTGTSWTYTTAMQATDAMTTNITFEIESVRDGLTSFQMYRFSVART